LCDAAGIDLGAPLRFVEVAESPREPHGELLSGARFGDARTQHGFVGLVGHQGAQYGERAAFC